MKKDSQPNDPDTRRPPIVVVMGHVDHGKTSILDWYRKTTVTETESGGITQHIGAYEVEHRGKKATFIDTPGHEAFPQIRVRGARIADIAILVVASDEGVKTQTREAIAVIRQNNIPFIVALNKIDKSSANPERVKQELAKEEVLVEGYGGKIPTVEISAKTGQGMDELLETVLLVAELENLKADQASPGHGVVLEVVRDARRGTSATLLILDGSIRKGQTLVIGRAAETIRIFEDFLGRRILQAGPSSPVIITGLARLPAAGETFSAFPNKAAAEAFIQSIPAPGAPERSETLSPAAPDQQPAQTFNIIIKADTIGSREALEEAIEKLGVDGVAVKILKSEIGDINESDVKLALAGRNATIIGFRVRIDHAARELIRHALIRVLSGDVIYELLDQIKEKIKALAPTEEKRLMLGRVTILKFFKKENGGQIVGGRVSEGAVRRGAAFEIIRAEQNIGTGIIRQLQRERSPTSEVGAGAECGMMIEAKIMASPGDILAVYTEDEKK